MRAVVSANYRDRTQKNWLVRKEGDPIDKYELRDRVVLRNFEFCPSFSGEEGFGCKIVGVGEIEESESAIATESLVRIRFSWSWFEEDGGNRIVANGSVLVLDSTGMYYLPA